jgi:hypothetical protein
MLLLQGKLGCMPVSCQLDGRPALSAARNAAAASEVAQGKKALEESKQYPSLADAESSCSFITGAMSAAGQLLISAVISKCEPGMGCMSCQGVREDKRLEKRRA